MFSPQVQVNPTWPKRWRPRPTTPPSSQCRPPTSSQSGSVRARSEYETFLISGSPLHRGNRENGKKNQSRKAHYFYFSYFVPQIPIFPIFSLMWNKTYRYIQVCSYMPIHASEETFSAPPVASILHSTSFKPFAFFFMLPDLF